MNRGDIFRTCDTNVVQALFIYLYRPDKIIYLEKHYSMANLIELNRLAKNLTLRKNLFITPQVMKEIELCDAKLPGILDFAKNHFSMNITKSKTMIDNIVELQDEYLKKDLYLSGITREAQSAIMVENKNGEENREDAHIVAENNVVNGYPFFSLNEKHLIVVKNSFQPDKVQRSVAILKKNDMYRRNPMLHKVAKRNLKKLTSTTFKVRHINRGKEELVEAMFQDL